MALFLCGEFMRFNWKKFGLSLLYPHVAVIICLLPISIAFLIFSLVYLGNKSILAIISYLFAFYVLMVVCFRVPRMVKYFKKLKRENKFMKKWFSDVQLRMNVSFLVHLFGMLRLQFFN